jgi:hypothetical protein
MTVSRQGDGRPISVTIKTTKFRWRVDERNDMTTIVTRVDEEEDGDGSGSVLMTLPDIQLSDFRESDSRRKKQHRNTRPSRL